METENTDKGIFRYKRVKRKVFNFRFFSRLEGLLLKIPILWLILLLLPARCVKEELKNLEHDLVINLGLTILDENMTPVEGAECRLYHSYQNMQNRTESIDLAVTDVNGVAKFQYLHNGKYYVRVIKTDFVNGQIWYNDSSESMLEINIPIPEPSFEWIGVEGVLRKILHLSREEIEGFKITKVSVGPFQDRIWDDGVRDGSITTYNFNCENNFIFVDTTSENCDLGLVIQGNYPPGLNGPGGPVDKSYNKGEYIDVDPSDYPFIFYPDVQFTNLEESLYLGICDLEYYDENALELNPECPDSSMLLALQSLTIYRVIKNVCLWNAGDDDFHLPSILQIDHPLPDSLVYFDKLINDSVPLLTIYLKWF